MQIERRGSFKWGATAAGSAPANLGIVIHYDGSNQNLANRPHSACRDYWRRTRSFHMGPQRGWADIGYAFGCCPHGIVLEGRGARRAQAAQPGGNTTWTSVTLMGGPSDPVNNAQIEAVRQLRAWLRQNHGLSTGVRGHRDFVATSCPGGTAYQLVQNGTFSAAPGGLTPGDDDVPSHRRFEKNRAQTVQRGDWVSLEFTDRHDGQTGGLYALVGVDESQGAHYDISVGVVMQDLSPGAEVQLRATEYEPDGSGGWRIARNRPIHSPAHVGGGGHFTYSWKGNLAANRRVRIRLAQFGDGPATVTSATSDVFYWPR